jgi:hypothetical protein
MKIELEGEGAVGVIVGVLGSIAVAALLVGIRSRIDQANVALALVLVVVLAAYTGGRVAGAAAGIGAAVSFDFFHTQPFNSLAIKSGDDIVTTALLVAIGVAVGHIATSRHAASVAARTGIEEVAGIHRVAALSASGASRVEVTSAVTAEVASVLYLRECRFTDVDPELPHLESTGHVDAAYVFRRDGFVLPPEGVSIDVCLGEQRLGWLACEPAKDSDGVSLDRKHTAIALADLLGLALATSA